MNSTVAYLDAPLPLAFAHRGGAAAGDENTLAAFARAVALGFRYIETDAHATADGVAVTFHDATLRRVLGRPDRVARMRYADLAPLGVPRLADVLATWPRLRLNIDVKSDRAVLPTLRAVEQAGAADRVLLASFSDARLARMRRLSAGRIPTSLATREVARLWLAALAGWPVRVPPGAVAAQVPLRWAGIPVVSRRFVRYAHRLGLQVHVWTVDDPATAHRLLDLGVDGIMTDRCEVLRQVYRERGAWPAGPVS